MGFQLIRFNPGGRVVLCNFSHELDASQVCFQLIRFNPGGRGLGYRTLAQSIL